MDFRRSNRHFQLSQDPRQQRAAGVQSAPTVSEQKEVSDESTGELKDPLQQSDMSQVNFEPAPPAAPEVEPPVIESMQTAPEPVTPDPAPAVEEVANQVAQPAVESHVLKPAVVADRPRVKKERTGIPLKYVIISCTILFIALIGSVVWQQLAIAELKKERESLSEQVKIVNPISVGAGASEEPAE